MSGKKAFLIGTIKSLTFLVTFLSFITLLPSHKIYFFPLEILDNFKAYLLLWHILALVVLFGQRAAFPAYFRILYTFQFVFVIEAALILAPYFQKEESLIVSTKGGMKIIYANVLTSNRNYSALNALVKKYDPDVVGLLEIDRNWSAALDFKSSYPYTFEKLRNDNFGLAVYSKHKFLSEPLSDFGEELQPAFYSILESNEGRKYHYALLHTLPPASNEALYKNRLLLRRISDKVRFAEEPVIVSGDFNATIFSDFYISFLDWTGLKNALNGRGYSRTWNAFYPFLRLDLDHVLYKNIAVTNAEILPEIGSDHLPIYAEYSLVRQQDK